MDRFVPSASDYSAIYFEQEKMSEVIFDNHYEPEVNVGHYVEIIDTEVGEARVELTEVIDRREEISSIENLPLSSDYFEEEKISEPIVVAPDEPRLNESQYAWTVNTGNEETVISDKVDVHIADNGMAVVHMPSISIDPDNPKFPTATMIEANNDIPEPIISPEWQINAEKAAEAMREIDSGLIYKEPDLKLLPQENVVETNQGSLSENPVEINLLPPEQPQDNSHNQVEAENPPVVETRQESQTTEENIQSAKPSSDTVASTISDAATQVKTSSKLVNDILSKKAGEMYKLSNDRLGMAAMFDNGMVLFEEDLIPEQHKAAYTYHLDEVKDMVTDIRKSGMEAYDKFGEFAQKAYVAGALTKYAGHIGTAADVYELGDRAKTAMESNSDSAWDAVTGQIVKMATNAAGGTLIAGSVARFAGAFLLGAGAPLTGAVIVSVGLGAALTYFIGKAADYIESEISKGNNPFSFHNDSSKGETEVAFVGDIDFSKYGDETSMTSEDITLIGNPKFGNLEIKSKSLNIIGEIHTEGKLIVDSEKVEMADLKALTQPMQTQGEDMSKEASEIQADETVQQDQSVDDGQLQSEIMPLQSDDSNQQNDSISLSILNSEVMSEEVVQNNVSVDKPNIIYPSNMEKQELTEVQSINLI